VILDEERLRASLAELTEQQAPPIAFGAPEAIARGRRLTVRRRVTRGTFALTAGLIVALAAVLVATSGPTHGAGSTPLATSSSGTNRFSAAPRPPASGTDPLTLSGTFGWLPANAQNVGYSLHSGQLAAEARGLGTPANPDASAFIWLTVYPAGTTPNLGKFANGSTQLRVNAPDVHGHTAYWVTNTASDPTNGGDTYLRWQDADGQWGELHAYYLGQDDVTSTMLRVAAGVDFAPHAVPLPLWISGLPSGVTANEADLNSPDLLDYGSWEVFLALTVDGTMIEVTVAPFSSSVESTLKQGTPKPVCKTQEGLIGCVAVTGNAAGSASDILRHLTLLGTDRANWTPNVLVH